MGTSVTHRTTRIIPWLCLLGAFWYIHTLGTEIDDLRNQITVLEQVALESPDFFVNGSFYPLLRIVDGDTIVVGVGSRSEYVRLIGIDAPEPNVTGTPGCYAVESIAYIRELLEDAGTVSLFADETQGTRDSYDRLLAYVELPDGTDVGEAMLRGGYAREFLFGESYERRDRYRTAESEAVSYNRGLFAPDACGE